MSRRRRTKAQVATLERQLFEVCEADHPVSVRHCFYRVTNPRLAEPVEKTDQGYCQVQDRLVKMREAGRLPYGWISDSTRTCWSVPTFEDPKEFVRHYANSYRFDLWRDGDVKVEVWCESRSIAGMIREECTRLAVGLFPCGGFSSKTFAWEAAQSYDGPVSIVYAGDYDPAGVQIAESLRTELHKHTDVDIQFDRVAVNPEQIALYDLPAKPRKATDKRRPDVEVAVEAEAMPAPVLRSLVREAIELHLPSNALHYARLMDAEGQKYLRTFGLSGPPDKPAN